MILEYLGLAIVFGITMSFSVMLAAAAASERRGAEGFKLLALSAFLAASSALTLALIVGMIVTSAVAGVEP